MHARRTEFTDLVERALQRELTSRRELRAHAQLAIQPNAPPSAVEEAYERLRGRYDAAAFAEYGPIAVATANSIAELLRSARDAMLQPAQAVKAAAHAAASEPAALPRLEPKPRADETCRALETLRGAIERRIAEAQAHRAAGRLEDAIRGFESVLVLDRNNQIAQEALRELRRTPEPRRPNTWSRMFGRLFRRQGRVDRTARAVEG